MTLSSLSFVVFLDPYQGNDGVCLLVQKLVCKHKGLIPDSKLRRASRFNLTIGKGDNSNTLVLTTAMRPNVTAKRYSRGTREHAELKSMNS